MRPVLNGLLGGLPFREKLLMPTSAWTSTLTSLAMRRLRNPSLLTILENRTPLLRHTPLLHPLLLLLMPDCRCILMSVFVLFIFCWAWDPERM